MQRAHLRLVSAGYLCRISAGLHRHCVLKVWFGHPTSQDPVSLPRSGGGEAVTMDRASITRHLLSSPYDPFNKQPLKAEQLVPNSELKARIKAWKSEQREKRQTVPMQE